MFSCQFCGIVFNFTSWEALNSHLTWHKLEGKISYPIRCFKYPDCKSNFTSLKPYIAHLKRYHWDAIDAAQDIRAGNGDVLNELPVVEPVVDNMANLGDNAGVDMEIEPHDGERFGEIIEGLKESLRVQVLDFLISLRASVNIPLKVSTDVMHSVKGIVDLIVTSTADALKTEFNFSEKSNVVATKLLELTKVLPSFDTEYKIRKLLQEHPKFVKPIPISLGTREETTLVTKNGISAVQIVSRSNVAQYISIEKTLRALLSDANYADLLFQNHPELEQGVYTSFYSSQRYRDNPLFCNKEENIVLLQLYYDGVGITNPLRGASTIHNCGMFYFLVLNLPPRFNASLDNIHTVAVCNSLDLKDPDCLDTLFEQIVKEISHLSTFGMEIEVNNRPINVKVRLAQVSGDSLGLHQILGLIESFSCDYCCMFCYATRAEMQVFTKEEECHLRTAIEYEDDISMLDDLPPSKNHHRGVKRGCILNQLDHFHIIDNKINDPMHTLLEGVIPYVMGAVLHSLSQICPRITLETVNRRINQVFGSLIGPDRYNKPCCLSAFLPPGSNMTPSQSAAQMWALFRYFPIIIGEWIIEEAYHYWNLFLILQEIVDIVFAMKLTDTLLVQLSNLVEQFLQLFKRLYPGLSIRPKLHFLLHLASIMRKNGPIRTFWCMNHERMNGLFKVPSHIMRNFRDPQQTLALRRQYSALQSMVQKRYNRNFIGIGKCNVLSLDEICEAENFDIYFESFEGQEVTVSNKVVFNGTEYRSGVFVAVGFDEVGLLFGKVHFCICEFDSVLLYVTLYGTKEFDQNIYSYVIKKTIPTLCRIINAKDLADPSPLDKFKNSGKKIIRLKHVVFP